jgi:hypothetical protein
MDDAGVDPRSVVSPQPGAAVSSPTMGAVRLVDGALSATQVPRPEAARGQLLVLMARRLRWLGVAQSSH